MTLDNPIIPASGTFGFGYEFAELYDINMLGTFSFKGTTREPRFGNPTPRIAEYAGGLLNAVGLQNPGVDAVIANGAAEAQAGISQAGDGQYQRLFRGGIRRGLREAGRAGAGGLAGGQYLLSQRPRRRRGLRRGSQVRSRGDEGRPGGDEKAHHFEAVPHGGQTSPPLPRPARTQGADGVSLINTLPGMRIDLKRRRPLLANTTGGMSGPGMFPLAVRMVYQVYEAVSIPIVGMGGVTTAEDVIELMLAGATAVGVGAANLVEPYACKTIIENLPAVMERYGMENLTEIIGGAHHG